MPHQTPGKAPRGFYATSLVVVLLMLAALMLVGAREWALADWHIATKSVATPPDS